MPLTIRKAESHDVQSLCFLIKCLNGGAITSELVENRLAYVEKSPVDYMYVCVKDEIVVGFLGFRIRTNIEEVSMFGEISAIVVHPDERGQGIGRYMVKYAENRSKELGCIGLWLVSGFSREEEAHKFYQQMGFRITGYRFVNIFEKQ